MSNNVLDCQKSGCDQALFADELWICADCGDTFCESHIADVGKTHSVYVCAGCQIARIRLTLGMALARLDEMSSKRRAA
jgi:hypothetical protein